MSGSSGGAKRLIDPGSLDVFRRQIDAFKEKFGREMGPDDPFFFDPDAETPTLLPPEQATLALDSIAEMMAQIGIDPAVIYAFKKTGGLLPTEIVALRPKDLAEWNAAMDEYYEKLHRSAKQ